MNAFRRYFGPSMLALGLVLALILSASTAGLGSAAGKAQDTPSPIATPTSETEPGEDAAPEDAAQGQVAQPGGDLPGEPAIQLIKVAEGFADPINVVSPPDGSGRLFVVERPGIVRIVRDGQIVEEPFLDLSDTVLSAFLEQGLYDLEFHPDYAANGLFYLHFAELLRNGDSMIVE
ncbi:MAG TPA: PQQ-dependent sugar dehydrogenase, partial [Anaerolineae bacterium]|nr:PQQ-dependent sugar dehydrogenase [Anaerolineae bacterium]